MQQEKGSLELVLHFFFKRKLFICSRANLELVVEEIKLILWLVTDTYNFVKILKFYLIHIKNNFR